MGDVAAYSNFRWDIGGFFDGRSFANADELIDFLAERLNMTPLPDALRKALRDYLAANDDPFVWTPDAFDYDYLGRGALYLLMSSPEYQLQ